ncbi:MAG: hypothetical protein ACK4UJ_05170 [Leptonema sp. (in: bacteria)]
MKKKLWIYTLILLSWLVNCKNDGNLGVVKSEKDFLDKNSEIFLLLESFGKDPESLEINGKWKDNYSGYHQIYGIKTKKYGTFGFWEGLFNRIIVEFDNSTRTLYVKGINEPSWADCNGNGTNGESGVECYSRIVWTYSNDSYYYCEIVFNKASLNAAKEDPKTANDSNPSAGGCGGFPWTKFVQRIE